MAKKRKHFRKDQRTGRFAKGIREKKRRAIKRQAQDYDIPLTRVAKERSVSLETVLRHKGGRLTQRQIQQHNFEALKKALGPVITHFVDAGQLVTVRGVVDYLKQAHGVELSRTLVSKALIALEKEGIEIPRPREHDVAMRAKARREARFAEIDAGIIALRKKFPQMRDQDLARELGIEYWTLRKRITALKKAGKLPGKRRGYKK
jgi:hypothetical protein